MIALSLSVIFSTLLVILFKWFAIRNIDSFQAIVVNYGIACISGIIFIGSPDNIYDQTYNTSWFTGALFLGVLFISIFQFFGLTAKTWGASVTSIAAKMSMIFPILFGIIFFKESIGIYKITGIIMALLAVVFSTNAKNINDHSKKPILFPIILFIGSGMVDLSLNYFQRGVLKDDETMGFMTVIFGASFISGILFLTYKIIFKKYELKPMSLLWGIALGISNWGALYFLLLALNNPDLESSVIFTLNNISIILLSIISGIFLFREKLDKIQWLGIILALTAIFFVSYS